MPNVLSPRDLVSSPDKMNETVPLKLGTNKTAITLTKKTVGRPSADLSADHRPIYRPIKCQISALFSSADKK